jgi:hypothetical protein
MGQDGLFGKLFRRKSAAPDPRPPITQVPKPRVQDAVPKLRVQDAVPEPVVLTGWSKDKALRHILGHAAEAPAVQQVLDLCDTLHGPTPPAPWREQMTALLADNEAGIDALRTIVLRETPFDVAGTDHRVPFVRSIVWAIGLTEPGDAVPLLIRITDLYGEPGRGREYRSVALTAVEALGWIGGERALPALRQIKASAKLGDVRRAASRELDQTLGEAHLSRADVPEWQAETFELDRDGLRDIRLDHGYTATIQLDADGTVTSFFRHPTGRRISGSGNPSGVRADSIREVSEIAANLRTVVYAERFRLKQLMQDQRTLAYEDWLEFYLGNPVTGRLCRSLVWESSIDQGEHWQRFLPVWSARREAWLRLGADGAAHDIAAESQARVVDPARITTADKRAWATQLRKLRLKQPFEQVDMGSTAGPRAQ